VISTVPPSTGGRSFTITGLPLIKVIGPRDAWLRRVRPRQAAIRRSSHRNGASDRLADGLGGGKQDEPDQQQPGAHALAGGEVDAAR
jgi:hypothetical protein